MWHFSLHADASKTSKRATLLALVAGCGLAVWLLWTFLAPHLEEPARPLTTKVQSAQTRPVIIPVDPELDLSQATEHLIDALIQIESHGDPTMTGSVGERGLMQIRRNTWNEVTKRHYGQIIPFSRAYEPELNREVGRLYLGDLQNYLYEHRDKWNSDLRSLLFACYNAGPDRVRRNGFRIEGLPASTRSYVVRASALHDWYLDHKAPLLQRLLKQ